MPAVNTLVLHIHLAVCLLSSALHTAHKDHLVQWDVTNSLFREKKDNIFVQEGDNLIFICSDNPVLQSPIYWTYDRRVYIHCDILGNKDVKQLMDCRGVLAQREFILKVSQFPEMRQAPQFLPDRPVFFMGHSGACKRDKFRIVSHLVTMKDKDKYDDAHGQQQLPKNSTVKPTGREEDENPDSGRTSSQWEVYRFLLLPGTLAILTLVGMQLVLCAFLLPDTTIQRLKQYWQACSRCSSRRDLHVRQTCPSAQPVQACKHAAIVPHHGGTTGNSSSLGVNTSCNGGIRLETGHQQQKHHKVAYEILDQNMQIEEAVALELLAKMTADTEVLRETVT